MTKTAFYKIFSFEEMNDSVLLCSQCKARAYGLVPVKKPLCAKHLYNFVKETLPKEAGKAKTELTELLGYRISQQVKEFEKSKN